MNPVRDRDPELFRLYSEMSTCVDHICADDTDAELEILADILRRTAEAGQEATEEPVNDMIGENR
ncbi:hypothetical protein GCM10029978_064710 [Actinoallomurus acanthiterrae]